MKSLSFQGQIPSKRIIQGNQSNSLKRNSDYGTSQRSKVEFHKQKGQYLKSKENQTKGNLRSASIPQIQQIRTLLTDSAKTLNCQEKLNLLKISGRFEESQVQAQSRFDFYWIDENAPRYKIQKSQQKHIFQQRKINETFERHLNKINKQKIQVAEVSKPKTAIFKPQNKLPKTKVSNEHFFTTFQKVQNFQTAGANSLKILPVIVKEQFETLYEEYSPKENKEKINERILVDTRGGKVNNDFLHKYLKAFCELENLSNEIKANQLKKENQEENSFGMDNENAQNLTAIFFNKNILGNLF